MRLLAKVKKLEKQVRARVERVEAAGVVWTSNEQRIDEKELQEGQHIATDIHITGEIGGMQTWRAIERASADPQDRGLVFDEAGACIGRVVQQDGSLVKLELEDGIQEMI